MDGALWAKFWQGSTWGTVSPDVLTRFRSVCLPLCHHECPPNSLPDGMAVSSPDLWCPTQPAVFVPARQPVTRMVCSYSRSKTLRRMHTRSPQSFPRGSVLGHPRNSLLAPCTHVIATAWEAHECIAECVHVRAWHHDYLAIWQGCAALKLVTAFEVANLLQGLRSRVEEHDGRIIACTMTTLPSGKAARHSNVYITAFEVAKLIRGLRSRVEEHNGRIVIWHHDHLAIW